MDREFDLLAGRPLSGRFRAEEAVSASATYGKTGHTRHLILSLLFLVTAVSFADRSMLSITGSALSQDLGLSPVALGYLLSAFGWAYAAGQLPGGWLLDRFGSKRIYALSLLAWSV